MKIYSIQNNLFYKKMVILAHFFYFKMSNLLIINQRIFSNVFKNENVINSLKKIRINNILLKYINSYTKIYFSIKLWPSSEIV